MRLRVSCWCKKGTKAVRHRTAAASPSSSCSTVLQDLSYLPITNVCLLQTAAFNPACCTSSGGVVYPAPAARPCRPLHICHVCLPQTAAICCICCRCSCCRCSCCRHPTHQVCAPVRAVPVKPVLRPACCTSSGGVVYSAPAAEPCNPSSQLPHLPKSNSCNLLHMLPLIMPSFANQNTGLPLPKTLPPPRTRSAPQSAPSWSSRYSFRPAC